MGFGIEENLMIGRWPNKAINKNCFGFVFWASRELHNIFFHQHREREIERDHPEHNDRTMQGAKYRLFIRRFSFYSQLNWHPLIDHFSLDDENRFCGSWRLWEPWTIGERTETHQLHKKHEAKTRWDEKIEIIWSFNNNSSNKAKKMKNEM